MSKMKDGATAFYKQEGIQVGSFELNICPRGCGIEDVILFFGEDMVINFTASYIGAEPLTTMIESLKDLEPRDSTSYIWWDEPGVIKFRIKRISSSLLSIRIDYDENESGRDIHQRHILIPYDIYRQGIIDASIKALKEYGCTGFNKNWADGESAMFIGSLISILSPSSEFNKEKDVFQSNIKEELRCLLEYL